MIRKLLILFVLFVTALTAVADETHTVLTSGGVVYTVDTTSRTELRLVRRTGELREVIAVPMTNDPAIES
ncbi:MAG TPA: hypothetical protein VEU30_06795, partial [Thermoanaerobaculia bacterium]|nr:hypothetical protein [Thermoanaerobaculia bacterium]